MGGSYNTNRCPSSLAGFACNGEAGFLWKEFVGSLLTPSRWWLRVPMDLDRVEALSMGGKPSV